MIKEQEKEWVCMTVANKQAEKRYEAAKKGFERASMSLQTHLKTKEDLFEKLQRVQAEIDEYTKND